MKLGYGFGFEPDNLKKFIFIHGALNLQENQNSYTG